MKVKLTEKSSVKYINLNLWGKLIFCCQWQDLHIDPYKQGQGHYLMVPYIHSQSCL